MRFRYFSFAIWLLTLQVYGQVDAPLNKDSIDIYHLKKGQTQSVAWRNQVLLSFQKKGYLLARVDSVDAKTVRITKGTLFSKLMVLWTDTAKSAQAMDPMTLIKTTENWVEEQNNNGYPFAKAGYVIKEQMDSQVQVLVQLAEGDRYVMDSLFFANTKFSKRFLNWTVGIKPGDVYRQHALDRFVQIASELEGFTAYGSPTLRLENAMLKIDMPVFKINKDYVSGLVGLATNPQGRPFFTGEATARFYNMFGAGVYTGFEWRSFRARSQELKLNGSLPFLLGAPFALGYKLEFEKFDTLFSNFNRGAELKFALKPGFFLMLGLATTERLRIYADLETVKTTKRLPENPASKNNHYHIALEYKKLGLSAIPERGTHLYIKSAAGDRRIVRDAAFEGFTWVNQSGVVETIYDSLNRVGQLRAFNYKINGFATQYIPIRTWLVAKVSAEFSHFQAPTIYFNELERFGGIKNIRGFNEQSIFANQFYMSTLELRIQNIETGFIGPFYHLAWYRNQAQSNIAGRGLLQGFGISSALNTGAGVLKIAWALGKVGAGNIRFNESKFHFGISTTF